MSKMMARIQELEQALTGEKDIFHHILVTLRKIIVPWLRKQRQGNCLLINTSTSLNFYGGFGTNSRNGWQLGVHLHCSDWKSYSTSYDLATLSRKPRTGSHHIAFQIADGALGFFNDAFSGPFGDKIELGDPRSDPKVWVIDVLTSAITSLTRVVLDQPIVRLESITRPAVMSTSAVSRVNKLRKLVRLERLIRANPKKGDGSCASL